MATTKLEAKTISQAKLRRYLELKLLVKEFETLKKDITDFAKRKKPVQPGPLGVSVKEIPFRSVSWKEHFIEVAGEDQAEQVLEDAPVSYRYSITVTNRDNTLA
jgi:hypothetical protein